MRRPTYFWGARNLAWATPNHPKNTWEPPQKKCFVLIFFDIFYIGPHFAHMGPVFLSYKSIEHDFVIVSDECYSEIYTDDTKKPKSLLQICRELGNSSFKNCVVFHSLSKRSNLPGLRSGFIAGDDNVIKNFLK